MKRKAPGTQQTGPIICYRCHQEGHTKADCPKAHGPLYEGVRCILAVGYVGTEFFGFAWEGGKYDEVPSITGTVMVALEAAGIIPTKPGVGQSPRVQLVTASKTDGRVHGVMNFMSLLLPHAAVVENDTDEDHTGERAKLIELTNKHLPPQIRLHDVMRVNRNFDFRNHCKKREYHYYFPLWLFDPKAVSADQCVETPALSDVIPKFNAILQNYVGSNWFHNFTDQKRNPLTSDDDSAIRVMYDVSVVNTDLPYVIDGIQFIAVRVVGQSFMMYQIRKMMGLAMAVVRGNVKESMMEKARDRKWVMEIPMAPRSNLFLYRLWHDLYNNELREDQERTEAKRADHEARYQTWLAHHPEAKEATEGEEPEGGNQQPTTTKYGAPTSKRRKYEMFRYVPDWIDGACDSTYEEIRKEIGRLEQVNQPFKEVLCELRVWNWHSKEIVPQKAPSGISKKKQKRMAKEQGRKD
eukprot:TRINITY_DN115308_c0_g1_i1.p1 TRINITY_DN115308_c0_g1~~TRINITY_DN115308_c0_g1_i1.p1  ORF type:complete len:466 (+),score=27.50 TRINITY_DN115308_c0_g1_i1:27-1424(+)